MVKVYWKFKGNKIGGIFRKMWTGEWSEMASYKTENEAVTALRQWKRLDYFRKSFDFSVGVNPAQLV